MGYITKLDLVDDWQKATNGDISISEFCQIIGDKLENISLAKHNIKPILLDDLAWMRMTLIDVFHDLGHEKTTMQEFDDAMKKLHAWSDYRHSLGTKSCEILI